METPDLRLNAAQTLRIIAATDRELQVESTWQPGEAPHTHWHPQQVEQFEVLEGELTVEVGDAPAHVITAGEQLQVPARTAHRMWNAGHAQTRALWTITPPGRTLAMFTHIHNGGSGRSLIRDLTMLVRFRREFRLGSPHG